MSGQIRDMQAAESALLSLQSKTTEALLQSKLTRPLVTAQMKEYLRRLQLDISSLRVIHVAGTKGKGSTCVFTESILRQTGMTTGLFTSPHLIHTTERFKINGQTISDELYLEHFWAVWDGLHAAAAASSPSPADMSDSAIALTDDQLGVSTSMPGIPSFFRFLTLVALHLFVHSKLDVVVLEVGMGGRLDSTNVIPHPVVCGISAIGYDHMEILGNTLTLIAREKGGISKPGVPVLTIRQPAEVHAALAECAQEEQTGLEVVPPLAIDSTTGKYPVLGLAGDHQRENAALAVALAHRFLIHYYNQTQTDRNSHIKDWLSSFSLSSLSEPFLTGLARTTWPGRCQIIPDRNHSNLCYYLDGAHTDDSMRIACEWYKQLLQPNTAPTSSFPLTSKDTTSPDRRDKEGFVQADKQTTEEAEMQLSPTASLSVSSTYHILLFNCGYVRNPFDLLKPVVQMGLSAEAESASASVCQFGHIFSCPFDHDRPHFANQPNIYTLLQQQTDDIQDFVEQLPSTPQKGDAPVSGLDSLLSSLNCAPVTAVAPGTAWQHTLQKVWEILLAFHVQQQAKHVQAAALKPPSSSFVSLSSTVNSVYPHRHSIHPSSSSVLSSLSRLARRHPHVRFRVFVCGSLYLVGNVMQKLGFKGL